MVTNASLSKSSTSGNFWLAFDGLGADAGRYNVNFMIAEKQIEVIRDDNKLFVVQGR